MTKIEIDQDMPLVNHLTTMSLLINLPITPFEKPRKKNKKSTHESNLNTRELDSKTVEDHVIEDMAQSKRGEERQNSEQVCPLLSSPQLQFNWICSS